MDPPLTSVRKFPEELGKHLAEFVLRRIETPDRKPQELVIPTKVTLRESTRRLGNKAKNREAHKCNTGPLFCEKTRQNCSTPQKSSFKANWISLGARAPFTLPKGADALAPLPSTS